MSGARGSDGRRRTSARSLPRTSAARTLRLRIHRPWTQRFEDGAGRLELHRERARMLHGLADALGLEVENWGETDADYPRELVEIAIAVGTAALTTAVGEIVKAWFARGRVRDVEIVRPDGSTISVRGMSRGEMARLGRVLWTEAERVARRRARARRAATRRRG